MQRELSVLLLFILSWMLLLVGAFCPAHASDNYYGGVQVSVPFSFDGVGFQIVGRAGNTEARIGFDSNDNYQFGAGLTGGKSDGVVTSIGVAYSTFHQGAVPYAGVRYSPGNFEYGGITYGLLTRETSYLVVGRKVGWSDERGGDGDAPDGSTGDSNSSVPNDSPSTGGGGDSGGTDDGQGGSGDDDEVPGGDVPGGGGDVTGPGDHSHSGLGDGTNPGKGKGRENSPNTGTENPNNAGS